MKITEQELRNIIREVVKSKLLAQQQKFVPDGDKKLKKEGGSSMGADTFIGGAYGMGGDSQLVEPQDYLKNKGQKNEDEDKDTTQLGSREPTPYGVVNERNEADALYRDLPGTPGGSGRISYPKHFVPDGDKPLCQPLLKQEKEEEDKVGSPDVALSLEPHLLQNTEETQAMEDYYQNKPFENLNELVNFLLTEKGPTPFASKKQQRLFYAKAAKGGKEGKKWKKWTKDKTKATDFDKIPKKSI